MSPTTTGETEASPDGPLEFLTAKFQGDGR